MDATGAIVNVEPRNVDAAAPADTAVNPACTSTTIDQGSHIHCICTTKNLAKKLQELTRTAQAVGERMTVRRRTCSIHGQGGRRARPGWSRAFPRRRLTRSHQGQRRPRRQWLHSDKLRRPAGPGKLFASTSVEGSESLTGRVIVAVTLFLRGFTADHLVVSFVRTASYAHTGSERWR